MIPDMATRPRWLVLLVAAAGLLLAALALRSQKTLRSHFQTPIAPSRSSRVPSSPSTSSLAAVTASTTQIAASQPTTDTTGWKTLANEHGWSVRYPPSWQALAVEANKAEEDFQPILTGPRGCQQKGQECGLAQLGSGWRPPTPRQAALSAKEALLEAIPSDQYHILLQQGNTVWGGQPAYFVVYRMTLYEDYPNGVIFKEIETKYRNQFYFIVFNEEGTNRAAISVINSPDGWALNPIFEAIISSFTFTLK